MLPVYNSPNACMCRVSQWDSKNVYADIATGFLWSFVVCGLSVHGFNCFYEISQIISIWIIILSSIYNIFNAWEWSVLPKHVARVDGANNVCCVWWYMFINFWYMDFTLYVPCIVTNYINKPTRCTFCMYLF